MKSVNFNNASFILGATTTKSFIKGALAEVAIVGRSNVGKSSLINLLTNHKTLAKVSNTPGRTQQANYFNIDNQFLLVDLPGYGYAKLSKTEYKHINDIINKYLNKSINLKLVLLVVDIRHELKNSDLAMIQLLSELKISIKIVLNKSEKKHTKEEYWKNQILALKKQYATINTELEDIPISTNNKKSLENIQATICAALLKEEK